MSADPGEQMEGLRAVVAESEPTVRGALCALAAQSLGLQVVGEAATSEALQCQVEEHKPDLVIVAWHLIAARADAALAVLRDAAEDLRIVVLGARPDMREAAMRAGADGYLSKVDSPEVVLRVLRSHFEHVSCESAQSGGMS
jgi:DNA-binding NarL/FixJ family response regulator